MRSYGGWEKARSLILVAQRADFIDKRLSANHVRRRAEKSLSDLSGTDIYIHNGNVRGVFTQLCNAFVRLGQPTTREMEEIYLRLADLLPLLLKQTRSDSPFEARIFRDLVVAARALTRHRSLGSR